MLTPEEELLYSVLNFDQDEATFANSMFIYGVAMVYIEDLAERRWKKNLWTRITSSKKKEAQKILKKIEEYSYDRFKSIKKTI